MPEGDTIHHAAKRVGAALVGREIEAIETPHPWVYERSGRPCMRCGERVRSRGRGDDSRTTYWCPGCQA